MCYQLNKFFLSLWFLDFEIKLIYLHWDWRRWEGRLGRENVNYYFIRPELNVIRLQLYRTDTLGSHATKGSQDWTMYRFKRIFHVSATQKEGIKYGYM